MKMIDYVKYVGKYFTTLGYNTSVYSKTNTGLIGSVIAEKNGQRCFISCCFSLEPVDVSFIQQAVYGRTSCACHVATVVTNNEFTPAAVAYANANTVSLLPNLQYGYYAPNVVKANKSTRWIILLLLWGMIIFAAGYSTYMQYISSDTTVQFGNLQISSAIYTGAVFFLFLIVVPIIIIFVVHKLTAKK